MREEGHRSGGYGWKLVASAALTLGALATLQACSSSDREFDDKGGASGSGGASGAAGSGTDQGGTSSSGGKSASGGGSATGDPCEPGAMAACYESAEGESYGDVPEEALGSCKIGMRVCGTSAIWGACLGAVAAAEADTCVAGNDDNCNGEPNENCACEANETRECGTDVGSCQKGQQTCAADLTWGPCVGEIAPKAIDSCDLDNDDNCDGAANSECECINGTTQPCGTNTGNCQQGTQTCVNGVWSQTCEGEIAPQAKDACAPKGDDADCDGFPNEECACTAGDTQDCGNCGTLSCKSDGTWETECKDQGECSPGEIENDSEVCGNCGSQALRRTCSNSCAWGGWTNQGTCVGSGPCKVGDADETRAIACGNCNTGLQQQKRSCTAQCGWPNNWTNVGSCTGQGCAPGSTKAESDVSCGYCGGTQARESSCSQSCTWGQPTNKGACQQVACSSYPGDERIGYVTCFNDWPDFPGSVCTPSQQCCLTPESSTGCKTSCAAGDKRTTCDGPEDCGGSNCCITFDVPTQSHWASCSAAPCTNGGSATRCHTNVDCPAGTGCTTGTSSASGSYNGRCNVWL